MVSKGFSSRIARHRPSSVAQFEEAHREHLPPVFDWNGTLYNTHQWLQDHWTTGLVVLKIKNITSADIVYEKYYRGNTRGGNLNAANNTSGDLSPRSQSTSLSLM